MQQVPIHHSQTLKIQPLSLSLSKMAQVEVEVEVGGLDEPQQYLCGISDILVQ